MPSHKIFTDIQISKSKKAHVVCTEAYTRHTWHQTLAGALFQLHEEGVTEALIIGAETRFEIHFTLSPSEELVPVMLEPPWNY